MLRARRATPLRRLRRSLGRLPGRRALLAVLATLAVLTPLAWAWAGSLMPDRYSVAEMGVVDTGRPEGAVGGHDHGAMPGMPATAAVPQRSVTDLRAPAAPPDVAGASAATGEVRVTLVARAGRITLPSGRMIEGYTLNGTTPGPVIRAEQGQMVQVRLVNESVPDGTTLHWHGLDVPAGDDGVAGVTQDAVMPGQSFVYRFRADQVGTYWYHSHQVADPQVLGGLFGAVVITPAAGLGPVRDVLAVTHLYQGRRTINGLDGDLGVDAAPGTRVRVRVVNTDNGPTSVWVGGAPYRLVAVDGTDLRGPTPTTDGLTLTAGGRADLEVVVPPTGARVEIGGSGAVAVGPRSSPAPRPPRMLDLLTYGAPAPPAFDPARPDRSFTYEIGRRPGFVDGMPGLWWTVNGRMWPDVPMFMVAEGDVVRMRLVNDSGDVHPMHLHGHHALVLTRNGVPATGSPWWVDSLDVEDGASYEIAFVTDNPGLWMDHCHNLTHPAEGLTAHLMYEGVTHSFRVGGPTANDPE